MSDNTSDKEIGACSTACVQVRVVCSMDKWPPRQKNIARIDARLSGASSVGMAFSYRI